MSDMDALVDVAARAMAIKDDYDGCFERVDEYEALLAEFPDDYRGHDERPDSDYEDCEWWRNLARAALLAVGLPALLERVEAAEGRLAEEQREHDESLALTDAALDQRDALAAKVADAGERIAQAIEDYINPQDCGDDPTCEQCALVRQLATVARAALDASETP